MTIGRTGEPHVAPRAPGLAAPPYPDALLLCPECDGHIEALRSWGYGIGLAARAALTAASAIEAAVGGRGTHVEAISDHFGLSNAHHSMHVEPLAWLRLGETQATGGLHHFLPHADGRVREFLKALAPAIGWPSDLGVLSVTAETPAGRGRIDLLIRGEARGRVWGAVVEAKFEHSLKGNPLGDYKRHGAGLGMLLEPNGSGERTGALIVLGKKLCRQTRRKLSRNAHWGFVHWREVLRRFDAGLDEPTVDEDFRRFRRTLWDRSGSAR